MEKEFIPYEQALALKELGFDEPCFGYYTGDKKHLVLRPNMGRRNEDLNDIVCTSPLYQQAFSFFREKYNLYFPINLDDCGQYYFEVNKEYDVCRNTYEKAEVECLEILIEIVISNEK